MTENRLEALLLRQCHREHCPTPAHLLRKPEEFYSVAEIAEVVLSIDNKCCCLLSFLLYSYTYILHYVAKQKFKISSSEYPGQIAPSAISR